MFQFVRSFQQYFVKPRTHYVPETRKLLHKSINICDVSEDSGKKCVAKQCLLDYTEEPVVIDSPIASVSGGLKMKSAPKAISAVDLHIIHQIIFPGSCLWL